MGEARTRQGSDMQAQQIIKQGDEGAFRGILNEVH